MSFTVPRKRPLAFVLTLAVVAAAAAGIGYAAVPDSTGVIHGCEKKDGSLRIIDGGTCSHKESAVNWTVPQSGSATLDAIGTCCTDQTRQTLVTLANGTRLLTTCWINETALYLGMKNDGDTVQLSGLESGTDSGTGKQFLFPDSQYEATATSDGAFLGTAAVEQSSRSYTDWDLLARDETVGGPFATIKLHTEMSLDGQSCNYWWVIDSAP